MVTGILAGMLLMLCLYIPALIALWGLAGGEPDPVTTTIQTEYPDLIVLTVLKFLLFHLATGGVLGMAAAVLTKFVIPPRHAGGRIGKRFLISFITCIVLFIYLNARFMVEKPMFYDALFNAQGGAARWIQNTLTACCSPAGIDVAFVLFVIVLILVRYTWVFRSRRAVMAGTPAQLPAPSSIPAS